MQSCAVTSGESLGKATPCPYYGCVRAKVNKSGLFALSETAGDPEN